MLIRARVLRISGRRLVAILAIAVAGVSLGGSWAAAQQAPVDADLARAKAALSKYQNPIVAVRDGYLSTVACLEFPGGAAHAAGAGHPAHPMYTPGGMGVHFLNMGLIGPVLDPVRPQLLIYEPDGDQLRLVAAEWFFPVAVGVTEPPKIFGRALEGPMEGHSPIMPAEMHHWDLHVWLWKNNPSGMFNPTNPDVKCPKAAYTFAEGAAKMVWP
jgi:hypothetical protein